MSVESLGTRKPGVTFVPVKGILVPRATYPGEIIILSYTPSGRSVGDDLLFKKRTFPKPPEITEQRKRMFELRRSHYAPPFTPESTIDSLDLKLAKKSALMLVNLGYTMIKGVAVAWNDAQTIHSLVASELTHGTNGEQALTDVLEAGSYIGPFAVRSLGQTVHGEPFIDVLRGVGLWSLPEPAIEQ